MQLKSIITECPELITVSAFAPEHGRIRGRSSISLPNTKQGLKLACRLAKAVDAGKAFTNPRIVKDMCGVEYLAYDHVVLGRYLDADLKKMGF